MMLLRNRCRYAGREVVVTSAGPEDLPATSSYDNIALMPCNPSVGGPAKGHLVRELDALGGQMGLTADEACIQMRMLNTGKIWRGTGPLRPG